MGRPNSISVLDTSGWDNEYEIQAELVRRLQTALESIGLAETMQGRKRIGRIGCEIRADGIGATRAKNAVLDVVIWRRFAALRPDWRALWACELKHKDKKSDNDVKRLQNLLNQPDPDVVDARLLPFACTLNIQESAGYKESDVVWRKLGMKDTFKFDSLVETLSPGCLWACDARIRADGSTKGRENAQ